MNSLTRRPGNVNPFNAPVDLSAATEAAKLAASREALRVALEAARARDLALYGAEGVAPYVRAAEVFRAVTRTPAKVAEAYARY